MKLNEPVSSRIYLLSIAIILIILIVAWPIYFFGTAGFKFVEISLSDLIAFVGFEVGLILILVIFWEFYRHFFKNGN